MLRAVLCVVGLLMLPRMAGAQCPGVTTQLISFAKEHLTISTVATPLTSAVYKPSGVTPAMAVISLEGGSIRYDVVGTPTSSDGHPITAPASLTICGIDNIAAFKAISLAGLNAFLHVTYYKTK